MLWQKWMSQDMLNLGKVLFMVKFSFHSTLLIKIHYLMRDNSLHVKIISFIGIVSFLTEFVIILDENGERSFVVEDAIKLAMR